MVEGSEISSPRTAEGAPLSYEQFADRRAAAFQAYLDATQQSSDVIGESYRAEIALLDTTYPEHALTLAQRWHDQASTWIE